MSFGEKIKNRREELSLTQEDVGAFISNKLSCEPKSELSRQAVSKWERDETYPEVEKLLILASKLDMSLDEMFADELSYLRQHESNNTSLDEYPGLLAGVKTLAEVIKQL